MEDGRLRLPFVTVELPPDLRASVGERPLLIVGLRAEAFEDPARARESVDSAGTTFHARVDVVEWLGNEQYAYVPYDAPSGDVGLAELARELDAERPRSQLVVSVDPASRSNVAPTCRSGSIHDACTSSTRSPEPPSGERGPPRVDAR